MSDLLLLADQAEIATARLYERALHHRQDTPIAQAARPLEEITRRGDSGQRTRPQAHHPGQKSGWHETAEDIERRVGIDSALVELTTFGPPPWIDLSNIHFRLEVEDHQSINQSIFICPIKQFKTCK